MCGNSTGHRLCPITGKFISIFYENKYMRNMIRTNLVLAKNTMRYIDDLLTLNNPSFQTATTDIYPHELQLKITTECETKLSYLDILVTIENGKYSTSLYDKRDNFDFTIVNFPSNIPSGPAYGVYISQLVRISRICSNYSQFTMGHYCEGSLSTSRQHRSQIS